MEWPVLGKRRAAEAPAPRKKPRREPRHLIGKLDLVFSRANLPEQVEGIIERFVLGARHKAFFIKYGAQNASYIGPGFFWHPKIFSNTHARCLWNFFAKEPTSYPRAYWAGDMEAPEPRMLKTLEGKHVMITYLNGRGRVMTYVKLVTYASDRTLHVREDQTDPHGFTLFHERIQRLDLFVDLPVERVQANPRVNSAGQPWNCFRDGCRNTNCGCRN